MAKKGKTKPQAETVEVEAEEAPTVATPLPMNMLNYIPTPNLPGFQAMFKGIPDRAITALLGAPGACKSMMGFQLAVEAALARSGNIVIFDTENNWQQYTELAAGLNARFGITLNPILVNSTVKETGGEKNRKLSIEWEFESEPIDGATNIFVIQEPDFEPLSVIHGRASHLKIFDSGKFKSMMDDAGWAPRITDAPIYQFLDSYNVQVILYDSITNPLDEIPAVGENFPARADMTQSWMIQIQKLAAKRRMPILATFHESKNDTNPFAKSLKIEGGKGVAYNVKFCVYLLVQNEPGLLPKGAAKPRPQATDERAMYIARHSGRGPWRSVTYFQISQLEDETPAGLIEAE